METKLKGRLSWIGLIGFVSLFGMFWVGGKYYYDNHYWFFITYAGAVFILAMFTLFICGSYEDDMRKIRQENMNREIDEYRKELALKTSREILEIGAKGAELPNWKFLALQGEMGSRWIDALETHENHP